MSLVIASLAKTVVLVVLGCNGTPGTDETCDSSFNAESWYGVNSKQECETFLRNEFDPSDYLDMTKFDFAAVQCE